MGTLLTRKYSWIIFYTNTTIIKEKHFDDCSDLIPVITITIRLTWKGTCWYIIGVVVGSTHFGNYTLVLHDITIYGIRGASGTYGLTSGFRWSSCKHNFNQFCFVLLVFFQNPDPLWLYVLLMISSIYNEIPWIWKLC